MASDKLGAIQKPVLNLDLDISENGRRRVESIELSKEELERLLSSLEAANKVSRHHLGGGTWCFRECVLNSRVLQCGCSDRCSIFLGLVSCYVLPSPSLPPFPPLPYIPSPPFPPPLPSPLPPFFLHIPLPFLLRFSLHPPPNHPRLSLSSEHNKSTRCSYQSMGVSSVVLFIYVHL